MLGLYYDLIMYISMRTAKNQYPRRCPLANRKPQIELFEALRTALQEGILDFLPHAATFQSGMDAANHISQLFRRQ